ncbi:nuclear transport factor 2 family protein [Panacibacter ginsenosidivorans]|uniref:Nuclear transport factor 2 family protein n=1 Tax=Panacibacter ginsenosidivorans TaxID=1813871 RepID=A0A5B8V4F9_9BACT|nr:nuclear transport factor 2 family protein [Panacibacter ginsenosidivorans]QEC66069.1 nuclear transport factor 2 family protein [Panacibacter ginsenosidivorans]
MNVNQQLITKFYSAFQNKDYKTMQGCYADNATFNDPVFEKLNAAEVRAMWEMLITRGKDLQLTFTNVEANDTTGSAEWIAAYTFSASGHKVVNKIKANFVFENGKIVQHTDSFDFYTWAKQALGFKGLLLGWTSFLHNKVKQGARTNLLKFIGK